MSDFLKFLNTADLDTLTQVSGITRPLAGNLIAARPFESVDDCLQVKGMGKSLLGKLETFAEGQGNDSENRAMIPVEAEAPPARFEQTPPAPEPPPQQQDSFFQRLGRAFVLFLRALLKLILVSALIVGVGAALYYGLPYIQRTFIAPVEQNTAEIRAMEAEIAALQTHLEEMNSRVTALETSVEAHTQSIQTLEEMQATLETQMRTSDDAILLELKHEVMRARALDILARGRLYLAQSNFGLAKSDVQTARDLLAELTTETDDEVLEQALNRLDMSLANLPDFPIIASGDLEIAWQILTSGNVPPTPTPTAFEVTPTPTASVLETATATPFPPPTLEATPTP
ncbi:MAG TPA: helix-hairpin-helix domain-containing protein [Anaerolineales bacterium]|nr:helix-hairpin-helix domain-containing protein [Anaerolineales bacterium]